MYKFKPILKSTIWGGEKIVPYKQIASDQNRWAKAGSFRASRATNRS